MASQKKLQIAAAKFRKEYPNLYSVCSALLFRMSQFIISSGTSEVIVGIKNKKYYERSNS